MSNYVGLLFITLAEIKNPNRKMEERGELMFDQYPSVKLGEGTMTIKTGKDKKKQFGRFKEAEVNCN
ncbi:hypothetical protein [Sideroxydans lithotrophicus]|uniref:hypothetical protein n=1 Tax=Sideroxydans lithotrophicus TaxID=63745 RepID=UPI00059CF28D|nr:hypothetical protein [Sideroxydans lithotrophicus]